MLLNELFVWSGYAAAIQALGLAMDTRELRRIGLRADRVGADRQLRETARRSSSRPPVRPIVVSAILLATVIIAVWLLG
jgi:hypothetical protein